MNDKGYISKRRMNSIQKKDSDYSVSKFQKRPKNNKKSKKKKVVNQLM